MLLSKALGTGVAQRRQAGVAPGVPAGSAPCSPISARLSVVFPFVFRFLFPFLFLFPACPIFPFLFSGHSTIPTQSLLSSWPPQPGLLFVLRLQDLCGVCCAPVHAHASLFSVAAPEYPFSSVHAQPFSAFLVLSCASEPGEHLPAFASSPPHDVPVSTFARLSRSSFFWFAICCAVAVTPCERISRVAGSSANLNMSLLLV